LPKNTTFWTEFQLMQPGQRLGGGVAGGVWNHYHFQIQETIANTVKDVLEPRM